MKVLLIITCCLTLFFSCSLNNTKREYVLSNNGACIERVELYRSGTPSPDVLIFHLLIKDTILYHKINDYSFSEIYFEPYRDSAIYVNLAIIKVTRMSADQLIISFPSTEFMPLSEEVDVESEFKALQERPRIVAKTIDGTIEMQKCN
jgi:hypothetical protein